jgi:DNA-binding MarR family transcriptional regulator
VREIDRALAPTDITHLQFTALAMTAWMARSGEPVTQVTLARFGNIHPMQVSQVLKALEAKGMVTRPRSTSDTRAKHIEVTQAGIAALREAMPLAIAVQGRLFGEAGLPGGNLLTALAEADVRSSGQ